MPLPHDPAAFDHFVFLGAGWSVGDRARGRAQAPGGGAGPHRELPGDGVPARPDQRRRAFQPGLDPRLTRPRGRRRRARPRARPSGSVNSTPWQNSYSSTGRRWRSRKPAGSTPIIRATSPGRWCSKRRDPHEEPQEHTEEADRPRSRGDRPDRGRVHVELGLRLDRERVRQPRRPDRTHDVARLRQGDRQPGPDQLRGQVAHRPRGRVQRDEHRGPREPRLHRIERPRAREAHRRAECRRAARHHLPVRHVDAADRDGAGRDGPDRQGAGPELQLERLLGGRPPGRYRRRARLRDPGADRQPRDRLQQGPVPAGRHRPADARSGPGTTSPPRRRRSPTPRSSSTGSRSRSTPARTPSGTTTRCSGRRAATS